MQGMMNHLQGLKQYYKNQSCICPNIQSFEFVSDCLGLCILIEFEPKINSSLICDYATIYYRSISRSNSWYAQCSCLLILPSLPQNIHPCCLFSRLAQSLVSITPFGDQSTIIRTSPSKCYFTAFYNHILSSLSLCLSRTISIPFLFPDAAVNYLELVKELSVISSGPIKLSISKQVFMKIIQFGKINNYQPLKVVTVETKSLKQVLEENEKNYNFISKYQGSRNLQLNKLFKTAEYVKCESLAFLGAMVFACEAYFDNNPQEYQKVKKFGVKMDITFKEDEEYSSIYAYLNRQCQVVNAFLIRQFLNASNIGIYGFHLI